MQVNPLFHKIIECPKKIITLQGGGDAAKTITALQVTATLCTQKRNQIATITGETVPHVKAGALVSFQRYVLPDFERYIVDYNSTERKYRFWNGTVMEFRSFKDDLSGRGSERDILFMNESNSESYELFWQLQRKTRRLVMHDYNPTSPFWAHSKLRETLPDGSPNPDFEKAFKGRVQLYITDHRHNMFLSKEDHEAYETISDKELFRVYSRGLTGKITGLVFGHFKKWNEAFPDNVEKYIYGVDYGYTADPTTIVKIAIKGRVRIGKELCYEPGLSAERLKDIFLLHGYNPNRDDIYSEADPNMINQLRMIGIPVMPAIKGPGSIAAGISKVREHECYYTADSLNFERELMTYKFMEAQDLLTGKKVITNVPVDQWNHCCDAFRMADYTYSFRKP